MINLRELMKNFGFSYKNDTFYRGGRIIDASWGWRDSKGVYELYEDGWKIWDSSMDLERLIYVLTRRPFISYNILVNIVEGFLETKYNAEYCFSDDDCNEEDDKLYYRLENDKDGNLCVILLKYKKETLYKSIGKIKPISRYIYLENDKNLYTHELFSSVFKSLENEIERYIQMLISVTTSVLSKESEYH